MFSVLCKFQDSYWASVFIRFLISVEENLDKRNLYANSDWLTNSVSLCCDLDWLNPWNRHSKQNTNKFAKRVSLVIFGCKNINVAFYFTCSYLHGCHWYTCTFLKNYLNVFATFVVRPQSSCLRDLCILLLPQRVDVCKRNRRRLGWWTAWQRRSYFERGKGPQVRASDKDSW